MHQAQTQPGVRFGFNEMKGNGGIQIKSQVTQDSIMTVHVTLGSSNCPKTGLLWEKLWTSYYGKN